MMLTPPLSHLTTHTAFEAGMGQGQNHHQLLTVRWLDLQPQVCVALRNLPLFSELWEMRLWCVRSGEQGLFPSVSEDLVDLWGRKRRHWVPNLRACPDFQFPG